jgi:hypothetical protein
VTWQEYETGLEDRLTGLHSRVHRGACRVQSSRRVYIPKADGRQRPLGIAALEDKIESSLRLTRNHDHEDRVRLSGKGPISVNQLREVIGRFRYAQ